MEIYNQTTRFILITNEVDSIIEPIQSRCAPFMFGKLDDVVMENYIKGIALSEGIDLQPEAIPLLVKHVDGKPRDALNIISKLISQDGKPITKSVLEKMVLASSGTAWDSLYANMYINPLSSDKRIVSLVEERGINPKEIIERILGFLIEDKNIPDKIKTSMLIKLAEFDYRLAMRGTPRIQLRCLVWSFCNVGKEYYAKKPE
jgi:DNA polymerase III delta prime subunit